VTRILSSLVNKSQNEYWNSKSYDFDLFFKVFSIDDRFNRDFYIDEVLERYDEH
jgi:hypothetical protein